jgi:hypothetical protein
VHAHPHDETCACAEVVLEVETCINDDEFYRASCQLACDCFAVQYPIKPTGLHQVAMPCPPIVAENAAISTPRGSFLSAKESYEGLKDEADKRIYRERKPTNSALSHNHT